MAMEKALSDMATSLESNTSSAPETAVVEPPQRIRIGLMAVATVVLGGIGAAWWYRKTLIRLRQAGETGQNPHFGISNSDSPDEL